MLGAVFIAAGATDRLGVVAGGVIVLASILLLYVDRNRFMVRREWVRQTIPSSIGTYFDWVGLDALRRRARRPVPAGPRR